MSKESIKVRYYYLHKYLGDRGETRYRICDSSKEIPKERRNNEQREMKTVKKVEVTIKSICSDWGLNMIFRSLCEWF
jgi:hypothetical protein